MNFYRFTLRVKHDAGYTTVRTVAQSEASAREMVRSAFRCPDRSIRRVWRGKCVA